MYTKIQCQYFGYDICLLYWVYILINSHNPVKLWRLIVHEQVETMLRQTRSRKIATEIRKAILPTAILYRRSNFALQLGSWPLFVMFPYFLWVGKGYLLYERYFIDLSKLYCVNKMLPEPVLHNNILSLPFTWMLANVSRPLADPFVQFIM